MWNFIRNSSDQYDQIMDSMIDRTLAGESVPFDEWQDLLDDLSEEDGLDIDAVLKEHNVSLPELVHRAETAREAFLTALRKFDLPVNDRFTLCQRLCKLAQENPSDELLRLYCDIVSDGGFLLDQERAGDEGSVCWLYGQADSDALYGHLSGRRRTAALFEDTLEQAKKIKPVSVNCAKDGIARQNAVFQAYTRIFELTGSSTRFLDNLAWLLRIADSILPLAAIKPLFVYRMLTRHGRRLQTSEDLRIDYCALWNYQEYRIDCDNGKNYKMNMRYLALFAGLCSIYQSDTQVNLPLCVYGFDHLSNLGELYRMNPPKQFNIPFDPPLEDIMDESMFSCFENGYDDNVVVTDYNISMRALERFQCSTERRHVRALEQISKYMNQHLDTLVPKFLKASPEQVKMLCGEVLEAAALPAAQQPKNLKETALFLAAINSGLMDAVDYYVIDYLIQAGNALIGE